MIKAQGVIKKVDGVLYDEEYSKASAKLPDNADYEFLIVDKKRNRNLPCVSYLFSVVLSQIAEQLPEHPATEALYRYFEEMFAPRHSVTIKGVEYGYFDLKREKALIIDKVTESIIDFVQKNWGITVTSKEELQDAQNSEYYSLAYKEQAVSWAKFFSHKTNISKNERRNQEEKFVSRV